MSLNSDTRKESSGLWIITVATDRKPFFWNWFLELEGCLQPALLNQISLSKSCKHWICQQKMLGKRLGNIDGDKGHLKDWKVFDRADLGRVRKGYFNALTYIPLIVSHPLISLWAAIVFLPSHNFGAAYSWHQHQGLMASGWEVLIMTNDLPDLEGGRLSFAVVSTCPSLCVRLLLRLLLTSLSGREQRHLSIFSAGLYPPTCQKYLPLDVQVNEIKWQLCSPSRSRDGGAETIFRLHPHRLVLEAWITVIWCHGLWDAVLFLLKPRTVEYALCDI